MGMMNNKRGITTLGLIFVIIFAIVLLGSLIILSYSMGIVDDSLLQIEGSIGNDSLKSVYENTLQIGVQAMETTVPQIVSTAVLLGMVIVMLIVGYNAPKMGRLWMIVDIGVLIVAEILAVLVTSNFTSYINSNTAFIAIVRDTLPGAAKFILNLPLIVPTIGVLIILATHIITREKEERDLTGLE